MKDVWPTEAEVAAAIEQAVQADQFRKSYAAVFDGDERWNGLEVPTGELFEWDPRSTYVREPPFFQNLPVEPVPVEDIHNARVLAVLGDSVTTDHISPAGSIKKGGPAAVYLNENHVEARDFNSFGSRRGNHEVMMRGTFANIRLRNQRPGHRGRRHALPGRRLGGGHVDLRRVDEVPGRRRAADHPGRQGVRLGLLTRLGGQGHQAARGARGDR
jgi:aconitase A